MWNGGKRPSPPASARERKCRWGRSRASRVERNNYAQRTGAFFIGEGESAARLFHAHAQQQPGAAGMRRPRYLAKTLRAAYRADATRERAEIGEGDTMKLPRFQST